MLILGLAQASPISWVYEPPSTGRVLNTGGWQLNYALGELNASPEFQFPLQLLYFTGKQKPGIFGSQWFCPQLESSLLPIDQGYLLWTMPSGQELLLEQDPEKLTDFISTDRLWRANGSMGNFEIFNQDAWKFRYDKGKLITIISPTQRLLEFTWDRRKLSSINIGQVGSATFPIVHLLYSSNDSISHLKLHGKNHQFSYLDQGRFHRLSAWSPPAGETLRFLYHPESGVLMKAGIGKSDELQRIESFQTRYQDPDEMGMITPHSSPKKQASNYWLIEDKLGKYTYGILPQDLKKKVQRPDPRNITLTHVSGSVEKSDYSATRGTVNSNRDGLQRSIYYYRSPGKRYDGKLRRIDEGGITLVEYRYDRDSGLLSESIDANGAITFFDYDPKYRPSRRNLWQPKPLRIRRGSHGKSEVIAEYRYDAAGRVTAMKDEHGKTTEYRYDARGDLAAISPPEGENMSYEFDSLGRCTQVSQGEKSEKMEYDAVGRLSTRLATDGTKTEFVYDENGHSSQIKRNGKIVKEILRDELQRVVGEKDALNRLSRTERDVYGNLTAEISPNGSITRYEYDSFQRRIAQIDGNGNRITFEHDPSGRLAKQTNPLGNFQTWKYDPSTGKLLERTNGEQIVKQSHDSYGRLLSVDYGNGQKLSYTHDSQNRPLSITGPDSSFEYSYDSLGRPLASRALCGKNDYLLTYYHNARGQRTGLILSKNQNPPDQAASYLPFQQTQHLYNSAGQLSEILSNDLPAIAYEYDLIGRPIKKTYGSAAPGKTPLTVDISYDAAGHLAQMKFQGAILEKPLELSYEWDEADQLIRRRWNGQGLRYEYDAAGQLVKVWNEADSSLLEAYSYDAAGNMRSKLLHGQFTVMTYNPANQIEKSYELGNFASLKSLDFPQTDAELSKLAEKTQSYSYDRAGRLISTGDQATKTYGWLDKVIQAKLPDGSTSHHRYWPDGQIASIQRSSALRSNIPQPESFLWDGLALLMRNDTLYLIEPHPSGGIPIASHPIGKPEEMTYHLNDLLGTTLATLDPEGLHFSSLSSFGQRLKSTSTRTQLELPPKEKEFPIPSH